MPCGSIAVQRLKLDDKVGAVLVEHPRAGLVIKTWIEGQMGNRPWPVDLVWSADSLIIAVGYARIHIARGGSLTIYGDLPMPLVADEIQAFVARLGRAAQTERLVAALQARALVESDDYEIDAETGQRVRAVVLVV